MGITEAAFDELLMDDKNFINNKIIEGKEIDTPLSTEEVTQRLLKVPEHKKKCTINTSDVTEKEAIMLQRCKIQLFYLSLYFH